MWKLKFEHSDISLNNLMYHKMGKGANNDAVDWVIGILHDWDLAKSHIHQEDQGILKAEWTGTVPYIALDIAKHWNQPFTHRYRHDLELFGWCLLFICLDCTANQMELDLWKDQGPSRRLRLGFLSAMGQYKPHEGFEDLYNSTQEFMRWLMFDILCLDKRGPAPEEKSDNEIWVGACNILRVEFSEAF